VTYDPKNCITAGELRDIGVALPKEIPDCAWIPRLAMVTTFDSCSAEIDGLTLHAKVSVSFLVPFTWCEATVTFKKDPFAS
jgi:hypothetical protein